MKQYIQNINTKAFFSGEIEILISTKIFNIDIIILEYIDEYKGYIQRAKFLSNNSKINPILVLEYTEINKIGHYNIIHLKPNFNIMQKLRNIPIKIGNNYNYKFLKRINQIQIDFKSTIKCNNENNIDSTIKNDIINFTNINVGNNCCLNSYKINYNEGIHIIPNIKNENSNKQKIIFKKKKKNIIT